MADTSQEAHLDMFCSTSSSGFTVDSGPHLSEALLPGHLLLRKPPEPGSWIQQVGLRGRESKLWTSCSARRIVISVGMTTEYPTLANPTGMAGTGGGGGPQPCRGHRPPFLPLLPQPAELCEKVWSNSLMASPGHWNSAWCLLKWFASAQGHPEEAVTHPIALPDRFWEIAYTLMALDSFKPFLRALSSLHTPVLPAATGQASRWQPPSSSQPGRVGGVRAR